GQYMEISKYTRNGPNQFARNPELAYVEMQPVMPDPIGVFWGIVSRAIPEKDIPKALADLENRMNAALEEAFAVAIKKGYKVSLDDLKFPDWNPLEHYEQK